MQMNDGRICNDFFIANLLLNVTVKEFVEDRLGFGKVMAKNKVAPFFPDTVYNTKNIAYHIMEELIFYADT